MGKFEIRIDGSLRNQESAREKTFWGNWSNKFKIVFDIEMMKRADSLDGKEEYLAKYPNNPIWTIVEITSFYPLYNHTLTKVTFNPTTNFFTFTQHNEHGTKSYSPYYLSYSFKERYEITAFKVHDVMAGSTRDFRPGIFGSNELYNTNIESRETKIIVKPIDCEFFDVSNLIITNDNTHLEGFKKPSW